MKKKMKQNGLMHSLLGLLFVLFTVLILDKEAQAVNYYQTVDELKANAQWQESYTIGTKQKLNIERLRDAQINGWYIMDETGKRLEYTQQSMVMQTLGEICIEDMSFREGTYYLVVGLFRNRGENMEPRYEYQEGYIEIRYKALREMPVGVATLVGKGTYDYSIYPDGQFPYKITYTSSNSNIATVDAAGRVTPGKQSGDVAIVATVEYPNQEPVTFTGILDVTNPTMESTVVVARKETLTIPIYGSSEYSTYYFGNNPEKTEYSNKKCSVYLYGSEEEQCLKLSISAKNKKKSQKITLTVDGKVLTFKVVFSNPTLKQNVQVVKKGKTLTIPVKGLKSGSTIQYQISDERIAYINAAGKVKGKKLGTTWLSMDVDGKTFDILIVVQKGKLYKVVKYAANQIGVAKYSQEKRMQKGYYDCSSLVWRSYKAAGVNIGNTTWALNSDGFANYYYKKGKHYIGKKLKTNKKLKCGDIIIRGKYKKGKAQTHHAELYIGDGYVIEAGDYGVHLSTTMGADIAVRPCP